MNIESHVFHGCLISSAIVLVRACVMHANDIVCLVIVHVSCVSQYMLVNVPEYAYSTVPGNRNCEIETAALDLGRR